MKKNLIITSVLGTFFALIVALIISADVIVSDLAMKQVNKQLAAVDSLDLTIGDIHVFLLSHMVNVKDVNYSGNGVNASVRNISVGPISYLQLIKHKTLSVSRVKASGAAVSYAQPKSRMTIHADSVDVVVHDIKYCFADSSYSYNDSEYSLSVGVFRFWAPDGLSRAEVHDLKFADNGPLKLGYTRYCNTVGTARLADIMKEPTTWIDVELNSLTTSPINPKAYIGCEKYVLDNLSANVRRMHVYRDVRYQPKHPYPMPQAALMAVPAQFDIVKADAVIHQLDVEYASTNINCGKLRFRNMNAALDHVTNIRNHDFVSRMRGKVGEEGTVDAKFVMHMTPKCNFDLELDAQNFETSNLNTFVRPLVGMTFDCHIDHLSTAYSGDSVGAAGQFTMLYHGLNVKVHKEDDIPYKVVTKNANTITNIANTLIPKSNPTAVDIHPRSYNVQAKRNAWQEFALYLFMPVVDGVMETMLPGLFVHKQVHEKKQKK